MCVCLRDTCLGIGAYTHAFYNNMNYYYVIRGLHYARVSYVISQLHPSETVYPVATSGVSAAMLGTIMHKNIEDYMNGNKASQFELKPQLEQFIAAHITGKWRLFSSEERIWDAEMRIAGTVDALFVNDKTLQFMIVDWKRTRGLYPDSAIQYQLQLNIYKQILARMGRDVVSMGLVILHPDNTTFKWVDVPDIDVSKFVDNAKHLVPDS